MIRAVVWTTIAGITAGPYPSVSYAPPLVPIPARVRALQCAGECPPSADCLEILAQVSAGIRASSAATTQWVIGT